MNIPNALTLLRLALTPAFARLIVLGRPRAAFAVLLIAAGSDALDGFLARRLHQVTQLGKILDPVADKLMQLTMMLCALRRTPWMAALIVLHLLRELCLSALGLATLRRTGVVLGARWYGKICTGLLYAVLTAALVWERMPEKLLRSALALCAAGIIFCLLFYTRDYLRLLREAGGPHAKTPRGA